MFWRLQGEIPFLRYRFHNNDNSLKNSKKNAILFFFFYNNPWKYGVGCRGSTRESLSFLAFCFKTTTNSCTQQQAKTHQKTTYTTTAAPHVTTSKMAKAQEEERRAIAAYLAGQFDDSCLPRIWMAADYHGKSTKFAPWNLWVIPTLFALKYRFFNVSWTFVVSQWTGRFEFTTIWPNNAETAGNVVITPEI